MKLIIDVKESFGDLIYLRTRDWKDFKTKEVKGQILTVGSTKTFEKIEIKVKGNIDMSGYTLNVPLKVETIEANFWEMNGKKGITFSIGEIQ